MGKSSAIYGVTVVDWNEATREKTRPSGLSQCLKKETEARAYIRALQDGLEVEDE